MLSHAAVFVAMLAMASATSLAKVTDPEFEDPADERIFITSNGGFSVTNASAAYGAAALLCAFLIFLLFAIVFGSRWFASQQSSGYGQSQSGYGYGNSNFYARSDRHFTDSDLATQMFQLAESFKKYEVTESDCQKYVSCEASQVHRHDQNGPLAKNVHGIMNNLRKHGQKTISEKDDYVAELFSSFMFGDEAFRQGKEDPCSRIREKCSATSAIPAVAPKKSYE